MEEVITLLNEIIEKIALLEKRLKDIEDLLRRIKSAQN